MALSFLKSLIWPLTLLLIISCTVSQDSSPSNTVAEDSTKEDATKPAEIKYPPVYAKNTDEIKQLVILEETIAEKLKKILKDLWQTKNDDNSCFKLLFKYWKEYKLDTESIMAQKSEASRETSVAENPLLTFRMLRRFVTTLLNDFPEECTDTKTKIVVETIDRAFTQAALDKPQEKDLYEALEGVLTLQFTYGISATTQLRFGIFHKIHTKVTLSFDDCVALARAAFQREWHVLSYQWMVAAELIAKDNKTGVPVDNEDLEVLRLPWKKLVEIFNATSTNSLHNMLRGKMEEELKGRNVTFTERAPCRGVNNMPTETQIPLNCYWDQNSDAYFVINPVKTEIISDEPLIIQYHDFATDRDLSHIKEFGSTELEVTDKVVANFNKKIEMMTGLGGVKLTKGFYQRALFTPLGTFCQIEKLRGMFEAYDAFNELYRLATFIVHLNDVTMGGNLLFTHLKTFVEPIKGSAVFWYNWDLSGNLESRVGYDICPVVLGKKQIANRPLTMPSGMILSCSPSSAPPPEAADDTPNPEASG